MGTKVKYELDDEDRIILRQVSWPIRLGIIGGYICLLIFLIGFFKGFLA